MNLLAYRQENNWTCGPACMKVILDWFGIEKKARDLVKELRTTKNGTTNRSMLRILKKYRIKFRVKDKSNLKTLKENVNNSLVIIGMWIPFYKESHFTIVKRIERNRIYLHDSWFGPHHSYSLNFFLKNWWDEEATNWFVAIKKRQSLFNY